MSGSTTRTLGIVAGVIVVVGVPLAVVGLVGGSAPPPEPEGGVSDEARARMEIAVVERRDLIEQESVTGTVGHGQVTALPIDADGLITWAAESGTVVQPGEVVVVVDGKPVTLARGSEPLYRELRRVGSNEKDAAGDKLGAQAGKDVEQLQQFLLDQGFDDKGRLEVDGVLSYSTERAIEAWQHSVGHPTTGRVDRTQLVFVNDAVRIEHLNAVGERFNGVTVTGTTETISLEASSKQRPFFGVGSSVTVDVSSTTTQGEVVESRRRVAPDGSVVYEIEVAVALGADLGDAEVADVTASLIVAVDVLAIPVRALVALAEGGWAVQLDSETGPRLTPIELGNIVGGMAEISGLDEGTNVVVPI